ncbi:fucose isomerase [Christensenellaceae bacterium OttesenSCG-928-K19]|nr:fucose isomerase [Christensenellaceae bacterium OttesenSCG-928-K19]
MLRNIPEIFSPDLMKTIMEMGHGDEICFGDVNFPSETMGQRVVRADGHTVPELLEAVLEFMPLDTFVEKPVVLMEAPPDTQPRVWETFEKVIRKHDFAGAHTEFEKMERFAFYERARRCFAVVATSEHEGYSNIILTKGVIFK